MRLKTLLRRGGGFGIYALLPAAVGIISVPIVIAKSGAVAFGGLAVGQTVGGLVSVAVAYGWSYLGPTAVALLPEPERPQYLLDALVSRLILLAGLFAPMIAVAVLFTPAHDSILVTCLMALALSVPGLSGSWYFIGQGRPRQLLSYDMAPNVAATVVGAVLLELGVSLTVYAVIQVIGAVVAITVTTVVVGSESAGARLDWRLGPAVRRLTDRRGRHAAVMALTTGAYINVPLLVVAQYCAPVQVAMYALANKLQKVAVQATSPFTAVAQGYVPRAQGPGEQRLRMRTAIIGCTAAGVVAGAAFAGLAPVVAPHFSSGHLHIPYAVSIPLGLSVTLIAVSGVVALACLATLGRTEAMTRGAVLSAVVGVGTALWWTSLSGPTGVSWSVAAAEGAAALSQSVGLWRALREPVAA